MDSVHTTVPKAHFSTPFEVRAEDIKSAFESETQAEAAARIINLFAEKGEWASPVNLDKLIEGIQTDRQIYDLARQEYERWRRWCNYSLDIYRLFHSKPWQLAHRLRLKTSWPYPPADEVAQCLVKLEEGNFIQIARGSRMIVATLRLSAVLAQTLPLGSLIDRTIKLEDFTSSIKLLG